MAFQDLLVWGSVLFVVAVVFFFASLFISTIASQPIVNQTFTSPDGLTVYNVSDWGMSWLNKFDWIFIFIFVVLSIGMFITGFLIPSHPVFLFVGILGVIFWLFLAPVFSNGYLMLIQTPPFASMVGYFPMMTAFFLNLPLIGLVIGAIYNVLLYGKNVNPYARTG